MCGQEGESFAGNRSLPDDANLVGLDSVRIIHGKGTGALRTAVRGYLQENRYVKNFRDGLPEEGGFGVTIVQLA